MLTKVVENHSNHIKISCFQVLSSLSTIHDNVQNIFITNLWMTDLSAYCQLTRCNVESDSKGDWLCMCRAQTVHNLSQGTIQHSSAGAEENKQNVIYSVSGRGSKRVVLEREITNTTRLGRACVRHLWLKASCRIHNNITEYWHFRLLLLFTSSDSPQLHMYEYCVERRCKFYYMPKQTS
jgi:hypothetical protein